MSAFLGFPEAAFDFYDDLEVDNTKSFWAAHKHVWESAVRDPMTALMADLAPEFGTAKIFRPYRDVRFAKDKTPYKTHQGAFVARAPRLGWYAEIAAPGFRVGAGFYAADGAELGRVREAIADDGLGSELEDLLRRLTHDGFEVGGQRLKTTPRGYTADHPRIELLRHKTLSVSKNYRFDAAIHGPELVEKVRADWRATTPLVDWVAARF